MIIVIGRPYSEIRGNKFHHVITISIPKTVIGNAACFFSLSLSFEVTFVSALSKWHSLVNSFVCELKIHENIFGEGLHTLLIVITMFQWHIVLLPQSGDGSFLISFVTWAKSWTCWFSLSPERSFVTVALFLKNTVRRASGYFWSNTQKN